MDLAKELEGQGYRNRVVDIRRLRDLESEIEDLHRNHLISQAVYDMLKTELVFSIPDDMKEAHSIIIVAVPDAITEIVFHYEGEARKLTVPPTYLHYRDFSGRVEKALQDTAGRGARVFKMARVPKKLLAARTGLALYGRNNISYVGGLGSYHRLLAYYSDLKCRDDTWGESRMLPACKTCEACIEACPSGAITGERFLIRAERCLTFMNENPGGFPDWVDPSWHNCLVGCMLCQMVCPYNRGQHRTGTAKDEVSDEETGMMLEGTAPEAMPRATREKLQRLDLVWNPAVLARNLRAIL